MSEPRITPIVMPQGVATVEENNLSDDNRRKVREAASALASCGFSWKDTAEGHDFWDSVHDRLKAISNGEPLK